MIKFEVVITAWDDGIHRGRRRIEIDEFGVLNVSNIVDALDELSNKIKEDRAKWERIMNNDDIPF